MAAHQVLFCPFCRECFEDLSLCPEHELRLVPFDQLALDPTLASDDDDGADGEDEPPPGRASDDQTPEGKPAPALAREDRPLAAFDPRFGRGLVALGALLNALALGLDLVRLEQARALATYELARALPSLWTLGLVSFTAVYALVRRRTRRALQSLRVLVPLLALVSPATLLWAFARLDWSGALGPAGYAVALASCCLLVGGLRLGMSTRAPAPPVSTRV